MHLTLRQLTECRLPGHSDEYRAISHPQLSQICQQLDIVLMRLAEAETRVNNNQVFVETRSDAARDALFEERGDVCHDIFIFGPLLHRMGLTKHMHQANRDL